MRFAKKILFIIAGSVCLALGFIGMFVPVLPTTPLVPIYRAYVEPFKQSGGISLPRKMRILAISYSVMGLSAFLVQKPVVWIVLAAVAIFLAVLMLAIIPTIPKERELDHGDGLELDAVARVREHD